MSAVPTETYPESVTEPGSRPALRLIHGGANYDDHTLETLNGMAPDGYEVESYDSEHVYIFALDLQTGHYSVPVFMGMCATYRCVAPNRPPKFGEQWRDGGLYHAPGLDEAACAVLGALADSKGRWHRRRWLFDDKVEHPDNWKC